jgi:hypothetical protein
MGGDGVVIRVPEELTLGEALQLYLGADEQLLRRLTSLSMAEIDLLVGEARRLARPGMARLLADYRVELREDEWPLAGGRILNLGECWFEPRRPPRLIVNRRAIAWFARRMADSIAAEWFIVPRLTGLVIAHELYHLVTRDASAHGELGAHVFARAITSWPFSPLLLAVIARTPTIGGEFQPDAQSLDQ